MQFDFTLGANGGQVINVKGKFVKYVGGTGRIRVRINQGGMIDLLPGQGVRGLDFEQLTIEDRSGAGNVGTILAGTFEFQDDRISGEVSVIDGGKARSMAGNAFAGVIFCGGVASQYAHTQIWNPAGSGKVLILETVGMSSSINGGSFGSDIRVSTAALTGAASNAPTAKRSSGATSAAQFKIQTYASGLLPGNGEALVCLTGNNNRDYFKFTEPYVIYPGAGVTGYLSTAGMSAVFALEWVEEAI